MTTRRSPLAQVGGVMVIRVGRHLLARAAPSALCAERQSR